MAFPVEESQTKTESGSGTDIATYNLPATIAAGDLLVLLGGIDGPVSFGAVQDSTSDSWSVRGDTGAATGALPVWGLIVAAKIADGDEGGGTVTVAHSGGSEQSGGVVFRISGWHGTTLPEVAFAAGANPPSLSPSWGSDDTRWYAIHSQDAAYVTPGAPANYSNFDSISTGGSPGFVFLSWADRNLAAASEDPGAFSGTAGSSEVAGILAIRPAASGDTTPPTLVTRITKLSDIQ